MRCDLVSRYFEVVEWYLSLDHSYHYFRWDDSYHAIRKCPETKHTQTLLQQHLFLGIPIKPPFHSQESLLWLWRCGCTCFRLSLWSICNIFQVYAFRCKARYYRQNTMLLAGYKDQIQQIENDSDTENHAHPDISWVTSRCGPWSFLDVRLLCHVLLRHRNAWINGPHSVDQDDAMNCC